MAINDAMGWLDYHLHHFDIKGKHKSKPVHIGIPDFDGNYELQEVYPGWEILMMAYFNDLGIEAKYVYDYGDDWHHSVKLEGCSIVKHIYNIFNIVTGSIILSSVIKSFKFSGYETGSR